MPTVPAEAVSRAAATQACRDRELITRFLATREETAFRELVARHGGLVMAVAWRVVRDRQAAEDVFQATFLVLAQKAGAIRKVESLAAWLHGAAYRIARKSLGRRQRQRECVMPPRDAAVESFEDVARRDEQTALDEEIDRLPESLRGPLVLHYLQDKSVPEIAAELGLSVSAVEGRLRRGRRELQLRLVRRGMGLVAVIAAANLIAAPAEASLTASLVAGTAGACASAALGATLPVAVTSEAAQLATKELIAMAKIGLLKSGLTCGAVALGVAAAGTMTTSAFIHRAHAQESRLESVSEVDGGSPEEFPGAVVRASQAGPVATRIASETGTSSGRPNPVSTPGTAQGIGVIDDAGSGGSGSGASTGLGASTKPPVGMPGMMGFPGMSGPSAMMGPQGMTSGMSQRGITDFRKVGDNEARIQAVLDSPAEFDFADVNLETVADYLQQTYQIPVRLDRTAFDGDFEMPEVRFTLSGVTVRSALELMLRDVQWDGPRLTYEIHDEVITITSEGQARNRPEIRVYDVRGLSPMTSVSLARVVAHSVQPESWRDNLALSLTARPDPSRGQASSSDGMMGYGTMGMTGMGGSGMMASMSGTSGAPVEMTSAFPAGTGDGCGWIEAIDGALVITQSQPVHREIMKLLEQLDRYSRAAAINEPSPDVSILDHRNVGSGPIESGGPSSAAAGMPGMGSAMMGSTFAPSNFDPGAPAANSPDVRLLEFGPIQLKFGGQSTYGGQLTVNMALMVAGAEESALRQMLRERAADVSGWFAEIINSESASDVRGLGGQRRLRQAFLKRLNDELFPDAGQPIRDVFFQEFVIE